ncbi:MAG: DUF3788 family protein [Ignavibacteriae bacterium]|nr:MAG: DUF3788 family protein [Ignavibacteriota bacterium]
MPTSIFTDKSSRPDEKSLEKALNGNYKLWKEIRDYIYKKYPTAFEEWAYPGKSFGWNFRVKDKKRVLVYFMPCDKCFKVSFVIGSKATEEAMISGISKEIKDIISAAKVYAEGRGFRIDVNNKKIIKDIKKLVDIKLAN